MKAVAVAVAVVAMFALASSSSIGNKNLITDIIAAIIEKNRDKLQNITIAHIDTDHGTLDNLEVLGADKFVLVHLDSDGPLSINIKNATVTLEEATYSAQWALSGLEVPEIGLTVNGAGELTGNVKGVFITVYIAFKLEGLTPQVTDYKDLYIYADSIEANLAGNENEEANNEIINTKLLGYLIANLPRIAEENKVTIIEKINEVIKGNA